MKLREFCVVCNSLSRFIGTLLMCAGMVAGLLGCAADAGPPDAAALRRQFPEQADAVLRGRSAFASVDYGFEPAMHEELRASFPARGGGPAHFELPDGFEVRVREIGAWGRGEVGEDALIYERLGGSSFWAATETGYEEWLLLDAGAVRREAPVAMWEVEGAEVRQHGEAILVHDGNGEARIQVTAPIAYAEGGRPVKTRLSARGATIELWVEADGEAVLVDPGWIPLRHSMGVPRHGHTMTLLPNGKVLIVGGEKHLDFDEVESTNSVELFDPATRTFKWAAPMSQPRVHHTATLLNDGRVLVVGGASGAELFDPKTGLWTAIPGPISSPARSEHMATLLDNGEVLVTGGVSDGCLSSAAIFDPKQNTWKAAPPMSAPRVGHTAIRLLDGRVLVLGHIHCGFNPTGEIDIYDPKINAWEGGPLPMSTARVEPGVVLLEDGRVLVAGGYDEDGHSLASVEVFTPLSGGTGYWNPAPPMSVARGEHLAIRLPNGRVLFAGGSASNSSNNGDIGVVHFNAEIYYFSHSSAPAGAWHDALRQRESVLLPDGRILVTGGWLNHGLLDPRTSAAAELFDPATAGFSPVDPMVEGRLSHQATMLDDGRVLVTGGQRDGITTHGAEVFEPETRTWTKVQPMYANRMLHAAVKLTDGRVLVAGGCAWGKPGLSYGVDGAELFDPHADPPAWIQAAPMSVRRREHGATLLKDGRVLVTGGHDDHDDSEAHATTEIFDPAKLSFTPGPPMLNPRQAHTMSLLSGDRVFVTGGEVPFIASSTELFDPATMTWSAQPSMGFERYGGHTATVLRDGLVFVLGGHLLELPPELYSPATASWMTLPFTTRRDGHTATLLPDGRVLIVGGNKPKLEPYAELFDPELQSFIPIPTSSSRDGHTATLLMNGQVLIAGGGYGEEVFDLQRTGTACLSSRDCKSGFCVDGVCCDRACDAGLCEACSEFEGAAADGTCSLLVPDCSPFLCAPTTGQCATSCRSAHDCAPGYACNPEGDCVPPPPSQSYLDDSSCSLNPLARGPDSPPRGAKLGLLLLAALATRRRRRVHSCFPIKCRFDPLMDEVVPERELQ